MKILALDMSSTMIGVCYDGRQFETIKLKGDDISQRCRDAHRLIAGWVLVYGDIDLVVIESPVGRFAKALIPQARVSGAVLAALDRESLAWREIAPAEAKKALTGKGNAKKDQMIVAAQQATGRTLNEHEADSYGLWKAASALRVESEAA